VNPIRIRKKLESDTLHLPELQPLVGKTVEIVVLEDNRVPAEQQPPNPYDTFFALSGHDLVDPDAYKRLREAGVI
jgi:hypothetical protein